MLNKIIKTAFLAVVLLSVNQISFAAAIDDFVIVVKTSNPGTSANNEFTIPTIGAGYNYNVDCDDANPGTNTATAQTGNYTCVYPTVGSYTIRIINNLGGGNGFPRIYFNFSGDRSKVTTLLQWGTGKWTSMNRAFEGAINLSVSTTDSPNLVAVTDMSRMFRVAIIANPDTSSWNTANVTDMSLMFEGATKANPDTSNWNTSAVVNMKQMFFAATSANPDTSSWNTANVTDMSNMFAGSFSSASLANPDTSNWNTANVLNMRGMFQNATVANPDTSNWNTANVTNMFFMFQNAVSASPDTSNWDISQVTDMQLMFFGVTLPTDDYDAMLTGFNAQTPQSGLSFHGGNSKYCATAARANLISVLGHDWSIADGGFDPNCPVPTDNFVFDVDTTIAGSTTHLQFEINTVGAGYNYNVDCDDANAGTNTATAQTGNYTCNYASPGIYTIRLSDNVGDKTGFPRLFSFFIDDAKKIIDLKQWGTGIWTSMVGTFNGASNMIVTATDIPDLSQVSNTTGMFQGASLANPNTTNWDVSNINTMSSMFANATSANPDTTIWNVSNVTTMYRMFKGATSANPDVSEWSTANVTDMRKMFEGATSATPEISEWDITGITTPDSMQNMLTGLTLPTMFYDDLLANFNGQTTASGIIFDAGSSQYCNVADRAGLISSGWTITDGGIDPVCSGMSTDDFVITVKTDNPGDSTNLQFNIPTNSAGVTYNYNVDCNDDGINETTGATGDYLCNYPIAGTYTIRIKDNTGTHNGFGRIYFNGTGDRDKILTLEQWGTNKWTSMERAFEGASNLTIPATDNPNFSVVTSMHKMFASATSANPNTSLWDTSSVTTMQDMFNLATSANPDTSNWITTNVTGMRKMFEYAISANPDTSLWDTSSVTSMFGMFGGAISANPDTSLWDTSSVTNMAGMFANAISANPNTSLWDTSSVTHMNFMFWMVTSVNPDTSSWDIENVTNMDNMFEGVTLPTADYDAMLIGFNAQSLQTGVDFSGGNSKYCAIAAHDNLESAAGHNWSITDGGFDSNCSGPSGDVIFTDGFEVVIMFKASDGFVEYDFNKLPTLPLDEKPVLVAQGLDNDKNPVIEIHLKRVEDQTLIRISFLDLEDSGNNEDELWTHQAWQVLENKGLTNIYW